MTNVNELLDYMLNPAVQATPEELTMRGLDNDAIQKITIIKSNIIQQSQINGEVNRKMMESQSQTFVVIDELKNSLKDTLKESKKAQSITKYMFVLTFTLGFVLIAFSIYFAMLGQQTMAIVFGSFGFADIIAHLIADPPLKIQDSRCNYAQLTAGILSWFNDMIDKSATVVANNQLSLAIQNMNIDVDTRLRVQKDLLANYLQLSDAQINNTVKILSLIDEVAEPSNKIKISKSTPAAEV